MAKRFSEKAKKQLIVDAVHAAVEVLKLQETQIELVFDNQSEYRATCEYQAEYQVAKLTFAPRRIRIWECVEFAAHEVAHITTWPIAEMLEEAAGNASSKEMEKAEKAYEALTTRIGQVILPMVLQKLEAEKQVPPEAKEMPSVVVREGPRRSKKPKSIPEVVPGLDTAKHP